MLQNSNSNSVNHLRSEEDEVIEPLEECMNFLTNECYDRFPLQIFYREKGVWSRVTDLLAEVKIIAEYPSENIFVVWLDMPSAEEGYMFLLFYDMDSGKSYTAIYNIAGLLEHKST
ncbi:hypothetical protein GCM10007907_18200 [Chitinimonas prasina]|uniref:Uncharacterized protein n=1 Tax=Chitinimonas prasina TaxID=1434937 RepID=A0ABQ5YI41_9NEIS|nr:hypothetical protein [Chitinimonas prasina]GLR13030.1 hypothetical protein GCM10007907_18200 [Chitinimonas prasina]